MLADAFASDAKVAIKSALTPTQRSKCELHKVYGRGSEQQADSD